MRKFVVLVPMQRNDKSKVPSKELAGINSKFWTIFGGSTIEGVCRGTWIDEGKVYRDKTMRLAVIGSDETESEFRTLVVEIGKQLGQLAMYVELDGVPEIIRTN